MDVNSSWSVFEVDTITRDNLDDLFNNRIAALRIPGFVSHSDCKLAISEIERYGFSFYRNVDPPIGRIGITQFEHAKEKVEYFRVASAANAVRKEIFPVGQDPVELVMQSLPTLRQGSVAIAKENGSMQYFAGLVRLIEDGALLHCDWAPHDAPDWSIGQVTGQIAWNIYYSVAARGGETSIYRQPWTPEIELYADSYSYGYSYQAVRGCYRHDLVPEQGDLLLFNSRNIHSVGSSQEGSRISASSFIGRTPDGELVLWS